MKREENEQQQQTQAVDIKSQTRSVGPHQKKEEEQEKVKLNAGCILSLKILINSFLRNFVQSFEKKQSASNDLEQKNVTKIFSFQCEKN